MEIELNHSTAILSNEGWQLDQEVLVNNNQRVIRLLFNCFSCFSATVITFEVSNGDLWFGGGSENDFFIRIYNPKFELVNTLKDHKQEVNLIKQYRHYLLTSADDFTIHWYDIENNYEHISYVYDKENENVVSFEPFSHWRIASAGVGPYNSFNKYKYGIESNMDFEARV